MARDGCGLARHKANTANLRRTSRVKVARLPHCNRLVRSYLGCSSLTAPRREPVPIHGACTLELDPAIAPNAPPLGGGGVGKNLDSENQRSTYRTSVPYPFNRMWSRAGAPGARGAAPPCHRGLCHSGPRQDKFNSQDTVFTPPNGRTP